MTQSQRRLIRTWVGEAINKGDLSVVDELAHPNYVYRNPTEELHGPEAIKGLFAAYRAGFPDLTMRIDDLVVEGDKVVQFFTLTGTHEGSFMGIPATGNEMSVSGVVLSRLKDEQIIEEWEIIDELAMFKQLGVISLPTGEE